MSLWEGENKNDSIELNIQVFATVLAKPSMTKDAQSHREWYLPN